MPGVPISIGTALVLALGCGVGVAVDLSGGGAAGQTDVVAPLSAAYRSTLAADQKLIARLYWIACK